MASSIPFSSATASPFIRRATTNAPSWAGVASPARISSMAARAASALRSRPETSWLEDRRPAAVIGQVPHPEIRRSDGAGG